MEVRLHSFLILALEEMTKTLPDKSLRLAMNNGLFRHKNKDMSVSK